MNNLTLVKLGGSLITDKRRERAFLSDRVEMLANVVKSALATEPDLPLIVGHGSGSFGHMAAKRHGTVHGVVSSAAWQGFSEVALAAADLNALVAHAFAHVGLPVMRLQPSASTRCQDGALVHWDLGAIENALAHGLLPLIHGDVAFDEVRGGTITSTETLFFYLAEHQPVNRILLLGEVEGVLDLAGQRIERITPETLPEIEAALHGSAGTDVTGGMETKVRDMVGLVQRVPGLEVHILDGRTPDRVRNALLGLANEGTLISA
ncbi:MAG TPA: isopentenyl phosphate kinase [Candidatus Limnocylindrales bacterium]|nr:isopentenyl phosphate kinase [Candidatus Limnocylindrales bacterium]